MVHNELLDAVPRDVSKPAVDIVPPNAAVFNYRLGLYPPPSQTVVPEASRTRRARPAASPTPEWVTRRGIRSARPR